MRWWSEKSAGRSTSVTLMIGGYNCPSLRSDGNASPVTYTLTCASELVNKVVLPEFALPIKPMVNFYRCYHRITGNRFHF